MSVTKIRSSLTSLLALPRHKLKGLLVHLHPPGVFDFQASIVVLPPQDILQSKINPKSPPTFFLASHLILAWTGGFDLIPTDLLMVGDTVTLPTDLRHLVVC